MGKLSFEVSYDLILRWFIFISKQCYLDVITNQCLTNFVKQSNLNQTFDFKIKADPN